MCLQIKGNWWSIYKGEGEIELQCRKHSKVDEVAAEAERVISMGISKQWLGWGRLLARRYQGEKTEMREGIL